MTFHPSLSELANPSRAAHSPSASAQPPAQLPGLLAELPALCDAADGVIVLDFETTGLSPRQGDRAIEIGAVRIEQGKIVARFQQLMNPGRRISGFIESYTGISNAMLADAPPCAEVMAAFYEFMGDANLVAHNASFDERFLEAELMRIGRVVNGSFGCSMLLSRRVYPEARSHRLGNLVAYKQLPNDGVFHRALADSEMTAHLWLGMIADLRAQYPRCRLSFSLLQQLSRQPKASVPRFLERHSR